MIISLLILGIMCLTNSYACTNITSRITCLKNCSCHWCNLNSDNGTCVLDKNICPEGTRSISCLHNETKPSLILSIVLTVFLSCGVLSFITYMGYLYYEKWCRGYKYYEYTDL